MLTPLIRATTALTVCGALLVGCGSDDPARPAATSDTDASLARKLDAVRERDKTATNKQTESTSSTATDVPLERDGPAPLLSDADRASFGRLTESLAGEEGVAIKTLGSGAPAKLGGLQSGAAWSTAKVPVAVAAVEAGTASSDDLRLAITASDNAAAERLWSSLGPAEQAAAAATSALRRAGDSRTTTQARRLRPGFTPFGQTAWRLTDQVRFMAGLGCSDAGVQIAGLMADVSGDQSWGLGQADPEAQFKGGWGPGITPGVEDGWLDRQMGILNVKGRPVAVAIATSAGDHSTGTSNLTRLAQWVADHVDVRSAPTTASCASAAGK